MATISRNVFDFASQEYSFSLRTIYRFRYENAILFSLTVVHCLIRFVGKYPCFRSEVEFSCHLFLHEFYVFSQVVFEWNDCHAWEVIDSLIGFETSHFVDTKVAVDPSYVPISLCMSQCLWLGLFVWLVPGASPAKNSFSYFLDYGISDFSYLENNLIL